MWPELSAARSEADFEQRSIDGFAFNVLVVAPPCLSASPWIRYPIRWSHAEASRVSMVHNPLRMLRDVFRVVRPISRGPDQLGVPERLGRLSRSSDPRSTTGGTSENERA